MKNIENQYKNIKNDYGDRISIHIRNKLQKIISITKQMYKLQLLKTSQQNHSQDRLLTSIQNQLIKIRRQIQGQIKLNLTDYQAYLWKLQKIQHLEKLNILEHFKLEQINLPTLTYDLIKKNFNIPILGYKTKDLIKISVQILMENKFCHENFNSNLITKLITQFSYNYNILPYHTFTHAFSVFMMIFQCKNSCQNLSKIYNQFQYFITFIAALCHDLNHKGTNSIYQIKKKTQIALVYNNQSVLENMHISQFYRICRENPDIDIISKIKSPVQRQTAKRLLNRLILATDALGHNKNLKKFQEIVKSKKQIHQLLANQKQIILQNLFHACDIGNPCLEFDVYKNWSILIGLEFNQQVKIEKQESLQVSLNMEYIDMQTHYRRQIGFIDFLVLPIWKQISTIFPQLQVVKAKTEQNKKNLQRIIQQSI